MPSPRPRRSPQPSASLEAGILYASDETVDYLGDPATLEAIMRNFGAQVAEHHQREQPNRATILDMQVADGLATMLLGEAATVARPVQAWNEPGGLDLHLARWQGIDETDPRLRVVGALMRGFVGPLLDLILALSETEHDGDIDWQLDALVQDWVNLLIGTQPAYADLNEEGDPPD